MSGLFQKALTHIFKVCCAFFVSVSTNCCKFNNIAAQLDLDLQRGTGKREDDYFYIISLMCRRGKNNVGLNH
ncbi:hypothetical protein CgunFtcFv8_022252 [Champsocephalus gunnari]|uniref:Secreted protein n=1 Tax=Champsocephalus gunnari TaxID=52237 RepID=A0AAN8DQJ1_CHAGU|nr:hypothetical protein CgunFtcFv8_022252 [Champsocephalus gunnari]